MNLNNTAWRNDSVKYFNASSNGVKIPEVRGANSHPRALGSNETLKMRLSKGTSDGLNTSFGAFYGRIVYTHAVVNSQTAFLRDLYQLYLYRRPAVYARCPGRTDVLLFIALV